MAWLHPGADLTPTVIPTETPTPTPTPEPTATPIPTDTPTPTLEPTDNPTLTPTPTPDLNAGWSIKTGMNVPRYALGVAATGHQIYAIGGLYSLMWKQWKLMISPPTLERQDGDADRPGLFRYRRLLKGRFTRLGGETDGHLPLATLEVYDPETDTWVAKTGMSAPRRYLAAIAINDRIYAVGGQDISGNIVATVEMYDPETGAWTTMASMSTARELLGLAAVNGKIYAICGRSDYTTYIDTVEEYNPATDTWVTIANMPVASGQLAVAGGKSIAYALGGWPNSVMTEQYSPVAGAWSLLPDMPTARFDLGAVVVDGRLYAVGGCGGTFTNLEVYTPQEGVAGETDGTPPSLTNIIPSEGALCPRVFTVSGSVYDSFPGEVRVNGQLISVNEGSFQTTVIGTEGTNTVTIEAQDSAGNIALLVRHVTVDAAPPEPCHFSCIANGVDFQQYSHDYL